MFRPAPRLLFVLVLTVASMTASRQGDAQPRSGSLFTVTTEGTLWEIGRTGTTTSLVTNTTPSHGITMRHDNGAIYWTSYGNSTRSIAGTINEWRNNQNTVVLSTNVFRIEEIVVNQNGEIVFTGLDSNRSTTGLFKWTGGSSFSTIVTTAMLGVNSATLDGGLDINVDTGNYLLPPGAFGADNVFDVAEDGTVTSLIGTPNLVGGGYTISQDKRDGAIYKSGVASYQYIVNGIARETTPIGNPTAMFNTVRIDRASIPYNARLLHAVFQSTTSIGNFLHTVSDPGGAAAVTSTALTGTSIGAATGLVFDGERNIGSVKTGPGAYDLYFSFPGEAGGPYVAAVGAAGYKPGFQSGGLNVCLNVDGLVLLSITNQLKPLFDPGPGVLDANGAAQGKIALGGDNLGVFVHLVAATIQGGTVRTVSSPYPMRL